LEVKQAREQFDEAVAAKDFGKAGVLNDVANLEELEGRDS
jgi:hypothetical protein